MLKITMAVTAAAMTMFSVEIAHAGSNTISIGYTQTHVSPDISNIESFSMPGVNVKYNWESDKRWGL